MLLASRKFKDSLLQKLYTYIDMLRRHPKSPFIIGARNLGGASYPVGSLEMAYGLHAACHHRQNR